MAGVITVSESSWVAPFRGLSPSFFVGRHAELGITEIVIRAPIADSDFAADAAVFGRIANERPAQLNK